MEGYELVLDAADPPFKSPLVPLVPLIPLPLTPFVPLPLMASFSICKTDLRTRLMKKRMQTYLSRLAEQIQHFSALLLDQVGRHCSFSLPQALVQSLALLIPFQSELSNKVISGLGSFRRFAFVFPGQLAQRLFPFLLKQMTENDECFYPVLYTSVLTFQPVHLPA